MAIVILSLTACHREVLPYKAYRRMSFSFHQVCIEVYPTAGGLEISVEKGPVPFAAVGNLFLTWSLVTKLSSVRSNS